MLAGIVHPFGSALARAHFELGSAQSFSGTELWPTTCFGYRFSAAPESIVSSDIQNWANRAWCLPGRLLSHDLPKINSAIVRRPQL
jgi:hypothetical protein